MAAERLSQLLPATSRRALQGALRSGVPAASVAFYARWWQLETWLRTLCYLELRAAYGRQWITQLAGSAQRRAVQDAVNAYMASPDADSPLAYLDVADLFSLIDDDTRWPMFEGALLPRRRWQGAVDGLRQLRHRSAHCRRPHGDDLARLEQVLRDLEPGARRTLSSYYDRQWVGADLNDPVVDAWIARQHQQADLIEHARKRYDTDFTLAYSVRPWAQQTVGAAVSGQLGLLWHARWNLRDRFLRPVDLWGDYLDAPDIRELVVHVLQDSPVAVSVTFAAVDDPVDVSDAIGTCFLSILDVSKPRAAVTERDWDRWRDGSGELDTRVQVQTPLAKSYGYELTSVFDA